MSKRGKERRPRRPIGDYAVGYCKPPHQHDFPKGVSGNPNGRPKAAKRTPGDIIDDVLNEPISVNANGEIKTLTGFEALVRKKLNLAPKGNARALEFFIKTQLLRGADTNKEEEGQLAADDVLPPDDEALLERLVERRVRTALRARDRSGDRPEGGEHGEGNE
jgi:hypothetical protein